MRRFAFQLAGLETLLVHRENGATLRAAHAAAERQRAESLLSHLEERRAVAREERRERRAEQGLSPRDEAIYERYFEGMGRTIDGQRRVATQAAEHHAERLAELRAAATRRRAIGLLHERRLAEHGREAGREMTRILDEVGGRSHQGRAALPHDPAP